MNITELNGKKVLISPHSPTSTMLAHKLSISSNAKILGFIDKQKSGENIFKIVDTKELDFDYILIFSPNHFRSIHSDYARLISREKLLKVEVKNSRYVIKKYDEIKEDLRLKKLDDMKLKLLASLSRFFDLIRYKRETIIFLSKGFVGTNNKMLFLQFDDKSCLITDNDKHLKEYRSHGKRVKKLGTISSYASLAKAKTVVQDQGNSNYLIKCFSKQTKLVQLWHGVPLKRLNRLVDVEYDLHISSSDYVNQTSLADAIPAKNHLNLGYPRNDLLLKEHTDDDLISVVRDIYDLAKTQKIALYMPTHRESDPSFDDSGKKLPLDLKELDLFLQKNSLYFVFKLHPFVSSLYGKQTFENILFYDSTKDIYPLLKYTDILITDYSSVYFDFLFVDKPIVFYDYDLEEYRDNMDGFTYEYDKHTPGVKVKTQDELQEVLISTLQNGDSFADRRTKLKERFFDFVDGNSSKRIADLLGDSHG